jgi:hypothetical protein
MKREAMVGDLVTLVLAVWLFLSPWIVGFTNLTLTAWIAWIVAIAIGAVSVAALAAVTRTKEWLNLALGLLLVISSWAVHFAAKQQIFDVLFQTGLIVAVVAILELWVMRKEPAPASAA